MIRFFAISALAASFILIAQVDRAVGQETTCRINMGGKPGTKREYANDVVFVEAWRYLPTQDLPQQ